MTPHLRTTPQIEQLEYRRLLAVIGDVNGDTLFDSSDLVAVFKAGEYEDGIVCNSTYEEGDWNRDCEFDTSDLVFAFRSGGYQDVVYPRLLFGPEEVAELRAKANLPQFATTFYAQVRFGRNRLTTDYSDPNLTELDKAADAARLAFLVLLLEDDHPERPAFAEKAREVLLHINDGLWHATNGFPARNIGWNGGEETHHWYVGGILLDYALGYDWLVGAGELTGIDRAKVKFRLSRLAQMEHEVQMTPEHLRDPSIYAFRFSNYQFRSLGGVGMAALVLPEQKGLIADPEGLMDPAVATPFDSQQALKAVMSELFHEITTDPPSNSTDDSMIGHYVSPDGYYGEGFTYQNDVFSVIVPFLVAYDHVTGLDYISEDGVYDGRIAKQFENDLRLMLPNHHRPTIGDAFYGTFYHFHEMMAPYTNNPDASHWYVNEVADHLHSRFGLSLPGFQLDPDSVPPPDYRTEFLMDTGIAVFRDKWGPDATYLSVVAEGRPVRGHNQADQGSLLLYAHGTYLIVDPGYGGAYYHDPENPGYVFGGPFNWIGSSLGHSGVTVDSLYTLDDLPAEELRLLAQPRATFRSYSEVPDPGHLEDSLAARDVDYVMAVVEYEKAEAQLNRGIAFPRHRYFILEDVLTADAIHEYGWQLHFGDSSTGNLENTRNRYVWSTPGPDGEHVGLGIHMLAGDRNFNVYDNAPTNLEGYVFPDHVFEHTYLLGDETAEDTRYLTLLDPHQFHGSNLVAEQVIVDRAWRVEHSATEYDLIVSQTSSENVSIDGIVTDAEFLVASIDIVDGEKILRSVMSRGGTYLQTNFETVTEFDLATDSVFHYESNDLRLSKPG